MAFSMSLPQTPVLCILGKLSTSLSLSLLIHKMGSEVNPTQRVAAKLIWGLALSALAL